MNDLNLNKYINDEKLNILTDFLLQLDTQIFINGHINTDYDSICSGTCLTYLLNKIGKKATMLFSFDAKILYDRIKQNDFDDFISTQFNKPTTDYVGIVVDMNATYRASFEKMFLDAKVKINIDHHDNNKLVCDVKYVDENAGANCENILKLALILEHKTGKKLLNKYFCELLSMGIITDTSNIIKSSNLEQTEWAINILKSYGVNIQEIANKVYLNLNKEQNIIYEKTIKSKQTFDYISYYHIDEADLKNINAIHNDYSMVLSKIIKNDTNPIILYEQRKDNESIWEFRSNDIVNLPINEIALQLGGGGHKNASGVTTNKKPLEIINAFLEYFNF